MMNVLKTLAYRLLQKREKKTELLDVETMPRRRLTLVLALAVGFASLPIVVTYLLLVLSSFSNEAGMLTLEDVFRTTYSLRPWIDFFTGKVAPAAGRLYTTWEIISIIANTLIVALGVTVVVVFTSVLAGYAFSRIRFPGRRPLMQLLILLHAFPGVALIIAVYTVYVWSLASIPKDHQWLYTFLYVILARASLEIPMSIWMMKGFFDQISWEVEWSALIDGASRFRVWWQVVLPQVKPGIAAVAIFAFLAGWEDFIYVWAFLKPRNIYTLATFIEEQVRSLETAYFPVIAAAGTLYLIPTILFFIFTQKLLLEAYSGGVKG